MTRFLLAFALLPTLAWGQAAAYKTQLLTVSLDLFESQYFYQSADGIHKFSSGMAGIGQPFPYEGPRRFILHESEAAFAPPDGEKAPTPAAFVDLPENSDRILLVTVPTGDKKIRLLAYDVSQKNMKNGDYRFFNFSKFNLALILDGERLALASGSDANASKRAWQNEVTDLTFRAGIVESDSKTITPASSAIWGHRPIRRNLVFIFNGVRTEQSVQIRRFYDIILPDSVPATAAQ